MKTLNRIFLFIFISFTNLVKAQELPDLNQFFKDMENHELKGHVGYEGTDIRGANKSLDEQESLGVHDRETSGECNKGNCKVSDVFSNKAAIERNIKSEAFGMNRNNKGFLDKALKKVKNADGEFDYFTGSYASCPQTEEVVTEKNIEYCDQYYQMEQNSCFPKQIVEIDPKYNYICNKKREVKEKVCSDVIKSIKCQNSAECDLGGIEPGSVASDMIFHNENGILTIGTISDNYWGGNCQLYDKTTTFKLKNIHLIKDFTIINVGFDDYMEILVNGTSVYAGPDGGSNLQIVYKKAFFGFQTPFINNGHSDHHCERSTNWNFPANIDLKPYLKEGENNIRIRVFVSGAGEGWLKIRAKQNCCSNWQIEREEKCEYK